MLVGKGDNTLKKSIFTFWIFTYIAYDATRYKFVSSDQVKMDQGFDALSFIGVM